MAAERADFVIPEVSATVRLIPFSCRSLPTASSEVAAFDHIARRILPACDDSAAHFVDSDLPADVIGVEHGTITEIGGGVDEIALQPDVDAR